MHGDGICFLLLLFPSLHTNTAPAEDLHTVQILFQNIRASIDDQIANEYGEYTCERHAIGTGPCSVGSDQRLPIVIVIDRASAAWLNA